MVRYMVSYEVHVKTYPDMASSYNRYQDRKVTLVGSGAHVKTGQDMTRYDKRRKLPRAVV